MRQALNRGLFVGGGLARWTSHAARSPVAASASIATGVKCRSRTRALVSGPDGKLTRQTVQRVLSGNRSRDDQPNHLRVQTPVAREVAEAWVAMCPAAVYDRGRPAGPAVALKLTPSNCVQRCDTAKADD